MNSIDLTPLYRNSIGFDRLATLLDSAMSADTVSSGYPPYDIEVLDDNRYAIVLAVAGFDQSEIDIKVEKGVLSVHGKKSSEETSTYLHHGIANRAFDRKFNLADYVEVIGADLSNGLLTINLVKEIPEAMKPKTIQINQAKKVIEHKSEKKSGKAA
jgi:molecular chaperone IbpA